MRRGLVSAILVFGLGHALALGQTKTPAPPSNGKSGKAVTKKSAAGDLGRQRRQIIFNILDEAHAATLELPIEQKIPILKEICGLAFAFTERLPRTAMQTKVARPGASPGLADPKIAERLKSWSEELYAAAEELPQGSYAKLDAQIAAVRAMVPVDEKRGLEMLDGLDASDEKAAEQQKNFLTVTVFAAMLQRHGDSVLPDLRARAQSMGEHGQYPYEAMADVLNEVQNRDMAQAIFGDAIASFQHANEPLVAMFDMLSMMRNEHVRQMVEPAQLREAAVEITNELKTEIEGEQRAFEQGKPGRPGLTIVAETVRAALKEIDPELAASIPKVPQGYSAPARGSIGNAQTAATSPEAKKQRAIFEKTSLRLMELSESEVHSGPELRQTIERGVEQGIELLHASTENAKDHVAALEYAIGPVTDFVQVGARTNPAMTLAAVRKVQDSEIRARLLVSMTGSLPDPRLDEMEL